MRVAFHTLGCKVNHYETEAIKEAFVSRGAVSVEEDQTADVYIINTCTVTNIADRKSRQFIRRARRLNPDALVVVTGCYAQIEPDEIAAMPEVDLIVGNGHKAEIAGLVTEMLSRREDQKEPDARAENINSRHIVVSGRGDLTYYENMGLVSSGESGMMRAYIKIQEGCDRFCSYCLIPYARGPVRSRPADEIIREAEMLVASGFRELVLTGVNTALYGTEPDFARSITDEGGSVLPGLEHFARMTAEEIDRTAPLEFVLARLDAMEGDFRVRLSSLEPTVVDKDNVEKIIRYRRLCHHLHLSVQNGSDRVLRSMNRHYSRSEYIDIVDAIREYDPLYGITTDIIAGFPGETEEDFADTLDIVRRAGFGKVHVFRYSPRKGTAGAGLPDQVQGEVKNERSDRLEEVSQEVADGFMRANSGTEHRVLIEEYRDGFASGYTGNYIRVYIDDPSGSLKAGEFVTVRLKELFREGCMAEPVL